MPDFHHNIYYYYRGAALNDFQLERQLEDNTTKALINTLEHSNPVVTHRFLDLLNINGGKAEFALQRKTIGEAKIKGKSQRLLLLLLPHPSQEREGLHTDFTRDSRPDAWIYGDDYVILTIHGLLSV